MALTHGGRIDLFSKKFNIAEEKVLDLSTGINPMSYPIGKIPDVYFQRLPFADQTLQQAAANYYFNFVHEPLDFLTHITATSGSQTVIQLLPDIINKNCLNVLLPDLGYKEHQLAWQQSGYKTEIYQHNICLNLLAQQIEQGTVVVIINPNNPSGQYYSKEELTNLLKMISKKNGLLIVDEAFIDCNKEYESLSELIAKGNKYLIILRSIGKFFGLAGIRLGFVLAHKRWISKISNKVGPWQVNGIAQYIGAKALSDVHWQTHQKQTIKLLSNQLENVLIEHFGKPCFGTNLFKTVFTKQAPVIFEILGNNGIYVRLGDCNTLLRFGLCKNSQELTRLDSALKCITNGQP